MKFTLAQRRAAYALTPMALACTLAACGGSSTPQVTYSGKVVATSFAQNTTGNPTLTKAVVRLTNATLGYAFDFQVPCSSSTFAWSGQVFPGTYKVTVSGSNYSNLPTEAFVANASLDVSTAVSGQTLDVKTAPVGGTLALNGAQPSTTTACNPNPTATKANVAFVDSTSGYAFQVPVACSATNFAWTGVVYPGTYRISVAGANGYSNLPSEGFLVTPRLKVQ